jgi:hypothetical protein
MIDDKRDGRLTKPSNTVEDRLILLVVLLQWKQTNKNRQNLIDRDFILVSHNHTTDATTSIVQCSRSLGVQQGLEFSQDGVVVREVGGGIGGVVDQLSGSVGSVGLGLGILV